MKVILKKEVEESDTDDHVIFIDRLNIPKESECKDKENVGNNT